MNENDVNQFRQSNTTNQDYLNNSSFMLARIDTSPLMKKIRKDIGGKVVFLKQDKASGQFFEEEEQVGIPLANNEGVMHICNIVEEVVNQHTVQGNLKDDHYWEFNARCREEITDAIILNCYDWDIKDKDLAYIINKVLRIIELFLTRPVNNKERESYQKEFQSREIIQTQPERKPLLGSFTKGMGGQR